MQKKFPKTGKFWEIFSAFWEVAEKISQNREILGNFFCK